jgi:hypothetical protein
MKDHSNCVRQFVIRSQAWYGPSIQHAMRDGELDSISFGLHHPEGGTTGEMQMVWHALGGKAVPRLEVFDDGWSALSTFPEVTQRLGALDDTTPSVDTIAALLRECGFEDVTPRAVPDD